MSRRENLKKNQHHNTQQSEQVGCDENNYLALSVNTKSCFYLWCGIASMMTRRRARMRTCIHRGMQISPCISCPRTTSKRNFATFVRPCRALDAKISIRILTGRKRNKVRGIFKKMLQSINLFQAPPPYATVRTDCCSMYINA